MKPASWSFSTASPAVRALAGLGCIAAGAWCIKFFHAAGGWYSGFWQPSEAVAGLPLLELAFDAWYLAFGSAFVALFTAGLMFMGIGERLVAGLRQLGRWKHLPLLLAFLAGAISLLFRLLVLRRQVIADDEQTYRFIAQTLLAGRVVNPLPDVSAFFGNQFVIFNEHGWFGQYPIGHPAVLAVAKVLGATDFLFPVMAGMTALLTWKLGRQLLGPRRAMVGTALVALSPHFTWTHGTLLSQPTSCFAMMLALLALLSWVRSRKSRYALAAGSALGFGLLVRPLPGVLIVGLALAVMGERMLRQRDSHMRSLRSIVALAAPIVLSLMLFGWVHYQQAGSPWKSGYQAQAPLAIGSAPTGGVGLSVFGNLVRENFWLFGWPLCLLPVMAARPARGRMLLWGPPVAALIYRIGVAKTVVSTTGPTYLMEAVPALALLASDGLARLWLLARRLPGAPRGRGAQVPLAALAATLAGICIFVPVQLSSIKRGVDERNVVFEMLARTGAERALIFTTAVVRPEASLTWAYFPPVPAFDLSDPVVFLRIPKDEFAPRRMLAYWQKRLPDRPAFVFMPGDPPRLIPLSPTQPPGSKSASPSGR